MSERDSRRDRGALRRLRPGDAATRRRGSRTRRARWPSPGPAWYGGLFAVWFAVPIAIGVVGAIALGLPLRRPRSLGLGADRSRHPPLRVAAGDDAVWVTSATDGTLSRSTRTPGSWRSRRYARQKGVSGVAVGGGSVWVSSPRDGEVLQVDPDSKRVVARIAVGGKPGPVAFGGGRVWVADDAGAGITAINASSSKVFKRGIVPHVAPLRLGVGAGALWVSSATTGAVRRIDLGDAAADHSILAGRGPAGVTVGHGMVWVANSRSGTVSRIDPSAALILGEPIPVGARPGGIDAGTTAVWVANAGDDTVSGIDLESGKVIGSPIGVGDSPGAVAVGEDAVWVADNGDDTITRIEP